METANAPQSQSAPQLSGVPIVVGERPMVFWSFDHADTQTRFLESIDPTYFTYLTQVHEGQLGGPGDVRAAVALRMTYSHALESLFALIMAAVQAPFCPAGWLMKYRNIDLALLVSKITNREAIYNRHQIDSGGWDAVANRLFPWILRDDVHLEHTAAVERLWRFLAEEFLDEHLQDEYNSLKHGLRVQSGGWSFAMGVENQPGVSAPPERMRTVAQSDYGSSFLRSVLLKKYQHAVEEQRVNWSPSEFLKRMPLVVGSIGNVITFLKSVNGVIDEDARVSTFGGAAIDEALSSESHSTSFRFSTRSNIPPQVLADISAQDILANYTSVVEASANEVPEVPDEGQSPK